MELRENITYELCPHCNCEVKLENELKIQRCPECGKWIVACSMCLNPSLGYSCEDCCLCILAHEMNLQEEMAQDL